VDGERRVVAATAVDVVLAPAPHHGVRFEIFFAALRMDAAVSPGFVALVASQVGAEQQRGIFGEGGFGGRRRSGLRGLAELKSALAGETLGDLSPIQANKADPKPALAEPRPYHKKLPKKPWFNQLLTLPR
jgi:hypothetical protein